MINFEVRRINQQLIDHFGKFEDGRPNFRIVWSDDEFEKRVVEHTDEGFQLLYPEVQEKPKYKHYIKERYILERLVPVPQAHDLVTNTSYEPIWTFENKNGPLPPNWMACKFLIDNLFEKLGKPIQHIKHPDADETKEQKLEKIKELEFALYGNETNTGDALATKNAIIVPRNYGD